MVRCAARTNSQFIDIDTHKKSVNYFYSSDDWRSKKAVIDEAYLRSYYEALYTWKNGGFILFDTLTYSPRWCPTTRRIFDFDVDKLHDFRCFDPSHYKNFMKRLRINLCRLGYDPKDKLKYQYVTEYGKNHDYLDSRRRHRTGTNRPHYHVLFYCTIPNLSPSVLSAQISKAWYYGRTDGILNHPETFERNVFNSSTDPNRVRGVTYYIGKYMTKDSDYSKQVSRALPYFTEQLYINEALVNSYRLEFNDKYAKHDVKIAFKVSDYGYQNTVSWKNIAWIRFINRKMKHFVKSRICQYRRSSINFGLYAADCIDVDSLIDSPFMKIPDKVLGVKLIMLPKYYKRKFFYSTGKRSNGKVYWIPNERGKKYLEKRDVFLFDKMCNDIRLLCQSDGQLAQIVRLYLRGRSISDFVDYELHYKSIFHHPRQDLATIDHTRQFMPMTEQFDLNKFDAFYYGWLWSDFIISQHSYPEFYNFDCLSKIIAAAFSSRDRQQQVAFDAKFRNVQRLRNIGFQTKLQI